MQPIDRLFRFLAVTALWLIAGMIYVLFFHEGGRLNPDMLARPQPPAPAINFPAKFAVTNAEGEPLRIAGEVTLARPERPQPSPKVRLSCKLSGAITTAAPSFRIFSGEWKPDREWPLNAKLECETVEQTQ
jgi:hypothetical protein